MTIRPDWKDDLDRVFAMTSEEVDAELRAGGVDPDTLAPRMACRLWERLGDQCPESLRKLAMRHPGLTGPKGDA